MAVQRDKSVIMARIVNYKQPQQETISYTYSLASATWLQTLLIIGDG